MLLALPNHAFFLHTSSPFPLGFSLASMLSAIYDKWGGLRGGPILPSKNGVARLRLALKNRAFLCNHEVRTLPFLSPYSLMKVFSSQT